MKQNDLIGAVLFLSGVVLFGFVHLAVALYTPHLGYYVGGRFSTILRSTSTWIPYVLSIILVVSGFTILILSWSDKKKSNL